MEDEKRRSVVYESETQTSKDFLSKTFSDSSK